MNLTDKSLLRNRFAASLGSYNRLAVVQDEICEQLCDMIRRELDKVTTDEMLSETVAVERSAARSPEKNTVPSVEGFSKIERRALEIGSGTGFLTRRLIANYPQIELFVNDIVEQSASFIEKFAEGHNIKYLWGDAENIELPCDIDLICSASTVQWFDNLPKFMAHAHTIMSTSATLAISSFGPENFREIKVSTGDSLNYYTPTELYELIERTGFEIIETKEYIKQLSFESPSEVLRHIKATGVNSIRKVRWSKARLIDFEHNYRSLFQNEQNMVTLTYHPILIIAKRL